MSEPEATTPFDCTPQQALTAVERHEGTVIVDFDETLYLRNSTSDFLSSASPNLLAFLIVKVLDVIKPWRRAEGPVGAEVGRDAWRVRMIMLLMPWTIGRWRRKAWSAMADGLNRPLADKLRAAEADVVVSTLGFTPIVQPLIDHAGLNGAELVAMNPWRSAEQRRGKLVLTEDAVGSDAVAGSAVITDSMADQELLSASGTPMLVVWPDAAPGETFHRLYYPSRYLNRVKRPGSKYVRSKIVREDLALWILASVWLADNPIAHVLGLVILAVSFWAVYEAGYVDNDRVAARHEEDPTLSDEFLDARMALPTWQPAAWAVVAGVLGLFVLRLPSGPTALDFGLWAVALSATYLTYLVYNRVDKRTRIYLFPLLQLARASVFAFLVPITAIAGLAIVTHVFVRWVKYYVYRVGGSWPSLDVSAIQILLFVMGAIVLARAGEWGDLITPTVLGLLLWHLFLARKELPRILRSAHRIDAVPR